MDDKPKRTPGTDVKSAPEMVQKLQRNAFLKERNIDPRGSSQLDLIFPNTVGVRGDQRFIPNDYARSSLFTARNKREPRRSFIQAELFHLHENVQILYTGTELRAEDDEIVWLQILSYGKNVPLGQPFEFSIKDLVKDVNWQKNGRYYNKVRECISRLKATEVLALNTKAYGTSGSISLISQYEAVNDSEGKPTQYRVWIDPKLILLFAGNSFTSHTWKTYRELSPVARRLADYVESHSHPYPLKIDKFKQMCGSTDVSVTSWRQTVRNACAELVEAKMAKQVVLQKDMICCNKA